MDVIRKDSDLINCESASGSYLRPVAHQGFSGFRAKYAAAVSGSENKMMT
jgi:hypothetical protein